MAKVLIVDDSKLIAVKTKDVLEQGGYEVVIASDGSEGLAKAKSENPDLIILDVMLPGMDGYTICRMLKFDEKYKSIPIIMFTAKAGEGDKATGKEVGADDYITKEAPAEDLLAIVNKHIKK